MVSNSTPVRESRFCRVRAPFAEVSQDGSSAPSAHSLILLHLEKAVCVFLFTFASLFLPPTTSHTQFLCLSPQFIPHKMEQAAGMKEEERGERHRGCCHAFPHIPSLAQWYISLRRPRPPLLLHSHFLKSKACHASNISTTQLLLFDDGLGRASAF